VADLSSMNGRNIGPKNNHKKKGIEKREGTDVASQMPAASSTSSASYGEEINPRNPHTESESITDLSDPKTTRRLEQVIINNCKSTRRLLQRHIDTLNKPFSVIDRNGNTVAMPNLNDQYDSDEDYPRYVKETFDYYSQHGGVTVDRLINNLLKVTRPGTGWLDWKEENSSNLESPDKPVNPTLFMHSTTWTSYYFIISVDANGKQCYLQADYLGNPLGGEPVYDLPED
jgi:hypothetical protein